MLRLNEKGIANPLMIPFILALVVILSLGGFATWAYLSYIDHRDNVAAKVDEAVEEAEKVQKDALEKEFLEREKEPLTVYNGPAALGSIQITHPKTWSVFVDESSANQLRAGLHPVYVSEESQGVADALRVSIEQRVYAKEVESYQRMVAKGEVSASAVKVSDVDGVRFDGEIDRGIVGAIVILPLRDKTLKIWTESVDYLPDYNNIVLPNFKFSP